jgi:DNA-binding response OmpR family regulator
VQTVVIVEHEKMLGALYELELSDEGYAVILAETAVQALKILRARSADLVVTDMSGADREAATPENRLIQRVRVPVIINTAYHECAVQGFLSNRVAHVFKSSNMLALKEKIKVMLARSVRTTAAQKRSASRTSFPPAEPCSPGYCHV